MQLLAIHVRSGRFRRSLLGKQLKAREGPFRVVFSLGILWYPGFSGGECLQPRTCPSCICSPPRPAMDLSPEKLRLEQDLRRMRSELDSGEVRESEEQQRALHPKPQTLNPKPLSTTELHGYREERNRRSQSPILRRARRQLLWYPIGHVSSVLFGDIMAYCGTHYILENQMEKKMENEMETGII